MASRATWKGALEINGFPVNIELHNRLQDRGGESFKMVYKGKPVKQAWVTMSEFKKLEKDPKTKVSTVGRNEIGKGVEMADGTIKELSKEAMESIKNASSSSVVEPRAFVPLGDLPRELAIKRWVIRPDKKVAGADRSVNQLWNGLLDAGVAYTTELILKEGGRDHIFAIFATEDDLYGIGLPFAAELNANPAHEFVRDRKVGRAFKAFLEQGEVPFRENFDHAEYPDTYTARRRDAIDKTLAGTKIEAAEVPTPGGESVDDLMAMMEKSIAQPKAKTSKGKKPARKKAAAK